VSLDYESNDLPHPAFVPLNCFLQAPSAILYSLAVRMISKMMFNDSMNMPFEKFQIV